MSDREPRHDESGDESEDHLVTIRTCESAFEAHALAAVLHDADIEAWVFDRVTCVAIGGMMVGVPLQVRRRDVQEATRTLEQRIADSVDIDWDEVDVGEPDETVSSVSFGRALWLLPLLLALIVVMMLIVLKQPVEG